MKRIMMTVAALVAVGGMTAGTKAPNPYQGVWQGTWHIDDNTGPVSFTVQANGAISGQFGQSLDFPSLKFNGRVRADGLFSTSNGQPLNARRSGLEGDLDLLSNEVADGTFLRRLNDGTTLKGTFELSRSSTR